MYEFESKSNSELKQSRFTEVAKRPLFYWSSPISIKVEIIKKKKTSRVVRLIVSRQPPIVQRKQFRIPIES